MSSTLVVNVLDLLRRAGAEKRVEVVATAQQFDFADSRIDDATEVSVTIELESSTTGIVARGEARVGWTSLCRRCLRPVTGIVAADIDEVFSREVPKHRRAGDESVTTADAEPLIGDQIDFMLPVREAVLLAVPDAPLCRIDCPGLCPQCGADRATTKCSCVAIVRDERWAALDALRGTLDDTVE